MAGEAAAPRAVRRSAAAAGPAGRRGAAPGRPQARGSEAAAAEAKRAARRGRSPRQRLLGRPGPRRGKRRCGSGRGGSPGPWRLDPIRAGARAGDPARDSGVGDQEVPTAVLRPGNLQD
ncbi:uncharacterized protein [Vicugna pacos]|uniref:Uncharacterized protein isoform X2 n=1 Tax=Vicugna pacos TaxID=30538 RepID=A0ABM5CDV2_VICPA